MTGDDTTRRDGPRPSPEAPPVDHPESPTTMAATAEAPSQPTPEVPTAARIAGASARPERRLDYADPLGLDAELTPHELDVRARTRAFAQERLAPNIGTWWEEESLPRDLIREIGALGILGMTHQEGGEEHAVAYGLAAAELEFVDSGLRSLFSVQSSLAMTAIYRFGSDEQRERLLPGMRTGEILGAFALTEPGSGSDPGSMTTVARKDPGGDWVLDGYKRWSTNAFAADIVVVWAKTDEGVRGFVVPTDAEGMELRRVTGKLSLRATNATEFELHGVRLPADAVLPNVVGLKGPLTCLTEARYGIVWGVLGAARACLEAALDHAGSRVQFDRPIAGFQLTQAKLADMLLKYTHAQLLALRLGRLKQAGQLKPEQVSMGKLANVGSALEIARTARTILGGNGITDMFPVMRHMANLESVLTYEGTAEVHTLVIGQALTGEQAFR